MPRKRRHAKRRAPQALMEVTGTERSLWRCYGPIVESDDIDLGGSSVYHVWPDWQTWAEFYGAIRSELYPDRPWLRDDSAAERLYEAVLNGEDPEAVRDELAAIRQANDPRRRILFEGR